MNDNDVNEIQEKLRQLANKYIRLIPELNQSRISGETYDKLVYTGIDKDSLKPNISKFKSGKIGGKLSENLHGQIKKLIPHDSKKSQFINDIDELWNEYNHLYDKMKGVSEHSLSQELIESIHITYCDSSIRKPLVLSKYQDLSTDYNLHLPLFAVASFLALIKAGNKWMEFYDDDYENEINSIESFINAHSRTISSLIIDERQNELFIDITKEEAIAGAEKLHKSKYIKTIFWDLTLESTGRKKKPFIQWTIRRIDSKSVQIKVLAPTAYSKTFIFLND